MRKGSSGLGLCSCLRTIVSTSDENKGSGGQGVQKGTVTSSCDIPVDGRSWCKFTFGNFMSLIDLVEADLYVDRLHGW